jgi:hypothetical protein
VKSLTAKAAEDAKENNSLNAKAAKDAKENYRKPAQGREGSAKRGVGDAIGISTAVAALTHRSTFRM